MIPERSSVANTAKSVFFEDVNDIDIYIEDTAHGYQKLFSLLFERVFEGKYKVDRVFPIGERNSVIKRFDEHVNIGRPSLFIIDGDLFILSGDTVDSKKGLYKLPFYCIENVLCDYNAIVEFLDEEEPLLMRNDIRAKFNYEGWLEKNEEVLFELFIHYAMIFKIKPSVQTVAYPINRLVSSNGGDVCPKKTLERVNQLRAVIVDEIGEQNYEAAKSTIKEELETTSFHKLDVISGKDYLFPLLKLRAKAIVKTKIPDINIKIRLAMKCDIGKLIESDKYVLC